LEEGYDARYCAALTGQGVHSVFDILVMVDPGTFCDRVLPRLVPDTDSLAFESECRPERSTAAGGRPSGRHRAVGAETHGWQREIYLWRQEDTLRLS